MTIGILTVHSQINYGAILQTYALQTILEGMGHRVVVLDRIIDAKTGPLLGAISNGNFLCWVKLIIRGCLGLWDFQDLCRRIKTFFFIKKHLKLSNFRFNDWQSAPKDLGVDLIIVGSDQIWNTKHHDPRVFLLDGAPKIPAITYAASFGTDKIDDIWTELFKKKLPDFKMISVRENQAKNILADIGISGTLVLDPTITVSKETWSRFIKTKKTKTLVCYFTTKPSYEEIILLNDFSNKMKCTIKVFLGITPVPTPSNFQEWRTHFSGLSKSFFGNIDWAITGTVDGYIKSFANADWIITSAFHGLMFAAIFDKQVRILQGPHRHNISSFSRLKEFADRHVSGPISQTNIKDAINSILRGETISYNDTNIKKEQEASLRWLQEAIKIANE